MSSHGARTGLAALVAMALTAACGGGSQGGSRYSRAQAQETLEKLERPGLVLGQFALPPDAILDGDTIQVVGLDSTLRLLAMDTEETYKSSENRRAAAADFQAYRDKKLAKGDLEKFGTPMGMAAAEWAESFFAGVDTVKLERDHPKEIRGHYNRYLAYAFKRGDDGEWINFNVEAVRAGMTPYFSKYGYSRRFHDEFVQAQKEARAAQRGIWAPGAESYGNYETRLAIWDARADFLRDFEERAAARDDYIVLTHWDALMRLEQRVGEEIHLLGLVGDITLGDGNRPTRVNLSRRRFDSFPIIFFDNDVYLASQIGEHEGHFVAVRGVVSEYTFPGGDRTVFQIVVNRPGQVAGSKAPSLESSKTAMGEVQ